MPLGYCWACEFENGGLVLAMFHCSICGENYCATCFKWHTNGDNSCENEGNKLTPDD